MGFTPLEGLVMGTRSGDIDPAIVTYIREKEHLDQGVANEILNKSQVYWESQAFQVTSETSRQLQRTETKELCWHSRYSLTR